MVSAEMRSSEFAVIWTEDTSTEIPFHLLMERAMADPIRFREAIGYNTSLPSWQACGNNEYRSNSSKYPKEVAACICFLVCQRPPTKEEAVYRYELSKNWANYYIPIFLKNRWRYVLAYGVLWIVGVCGGYESSSLI